MALLALSIWSGAALAQVTGTGTAEHVALWKNGTTLENAPWRIEANATSPSLIGGYSGNTVSTGVAGAVIGGGGESGGVNSVTFEFSTVGGGMLNTAGGTLNGAAVVSGGEFNQACGDSTTVAGGYRNVAGDAYGCAGSITSSDTVGGGFFNTAYGGSATVPGGAHNTAAGEQSFAAGSQTNAAHAGVFAWGDSSVGSVIASTAPNQFLVRAAGGLWLGTNNSVSIGAGQFIATSTGAYLSTGGTWTNNSDRNLKSNLTAINGRSVLERLAGVPMFTWNYKAQTDSVRHIGPMAQDFYAGFGLGEDDRHISTIDAEGVALAAIQEIYRDSLVKDAEIASLTAEVEKLKAVERRVNALAARLSDVETRATAVQQVKATLITGAW